MNIYPRRNEVEISNVEFVPYDNGDLRKKYFNITCEATLEKYVMNVRFFFKKEEGEWIVYAVTHNEEKECPFCEGDLKKKSQCLELMKIQNTLGKKLLVHPDVRYLFMMYKN